MRCLGGAGLCGTLWYTLRRSLHLGLALDSTVLATPVLGCSVPEAEHGSRRGICPVDDERMSIVVQGENALERALGECVSYVKKLNTNRGRGRKTQKLHRKLSHPPPGLC